MGTVEVALDDVHVLLAVVVAQLDRPGGGVGPVHPLQHPVEGQTLDLLVAKPQAVLKPHKQDTWLLGQTSHLVAHFPKHKQYRYIE